LELSLSFSISSCSGTLVEKRKTAKSTKEIVFIESLYDRAVISEQIGPNHSLETYTAQQMNPSKNTQRHRPSHDNDPNLLSGTSSIAGEP
jgi:hypothetical protein